jgi:hypothetical protein
MLTLSDLKTEYLDATSDDSVTNATRSIRRIAQAERYVTALRDWEFLYKTFTITSTAGTQTYNLPYNMRKIEAVTVVSSGIRYNPVEVRDTEQWNLLNVYSSGNISNAVQFYHLSNNGQISFFPTFASSSLTITITGVRTRRRPMSLLDYTTGTVAVTLGSTTVTGTTTSWTSSNVKPEAFIEIDGVSYEIASLTNSTTLVLSSAYQGSTASGQTYRIGDSPLVPEGFQDIIWIRACKDYFRNKENTEQKRSVFEDYAELLKELQNSTYTESVKMVIPRGRRTIINPNDYPRNIG